jgi:hypothetical protein
MNTARKGPPDDIVDFDGTVYRHLDSLHAGDRVDLIGDPFADPPLPELGNVTQLFQYQLETIASVEYAGRGERRVRFRSGYSCVCPAGHWFVRAEA